MSNEFAVVALSYLEFTNKHYDKEEMSVKSFLRHFNNLRKIFVSGVQAVHPLTLLSDNNNLKISKVNENREVLEIRDDVFDLTGKKCHLIGFGKAVLGMAVQMEKVLTTRLESGILSVPVGTIERFSNVKEMQLKENSVIKIFEGAANNLPDNEAMSAAMKIKTLAESMTSNDILFVMVTGGGSALLPLPHPLVTLDEKLYVTKKLVRKGASIDEVNIVRMTLSQTKGGKLAESAKGSYKTISFIIADMVHNDPDLIASGPSIQFLGRPVSAVDILKKYNLWEELPQKIKNCVENHPRKGSALPNNYYYVIGNNKVAVASCLNKARSLDYVPFVLSTMIEGDVIEITKQYTEFLINLKKFIKNEIIKDEFEKRFPFDSKLLNEFMNTITIAKDNHKDLCLILAGEPTVNIIGNGIGGRNQELAFRMSLAFYENSLLNDICFISAGTDGIDGPTDAAGAFGSSEVIREFLKYNSFDECTEYLRQNDSYNFYKNLNDGKYHIITGHTGTNVMDLHLFVIPIN